jgi:glycine/D-amino acid oxidase-like deaminating enzyme
MIYDYIIIGAGISGCSIAFELNKYSNNILLIDKLNDVAQGASGAAGAFLSPLLGKLNDFKDLVNVALKYSTNFYKKYTPDYIDNCGTMRIPKDEKDKAKFDSYIPFADGYFFEEGSIVKSYDTCKTLSQDVEKRFNYEVFNIKFENDFWLINNQIKTKNLILTTGVSINLLDELYFNIKAVWGQRIDIKTTTCIGFNYHKECSISKSFKNDDNTYRVSIGATHHRNITDKKIDKYDTKELLNKANDIIPLQNIKVIKELVGARASSVDYFPMIGEMIDSKKTLTLFPCLKKGVKIQPEKFSRYKNLFSINGIGGRGFVFAPFLAKQLVDFIIHKKDINTNLKVDRLFKRWVKKID